MDIGLTDSWITLTIKAPNQQIDDQTVKCKLDWSVAKLKGYIRETYPNKPKTEDQRLIYSGQLLTDSVILKDILRPYDEDGQLNRIVHLVCASSSFCIPPKIREKRKIESPKINDVNIGASTSGTNIPTAVNQEASTSSSNIKKEKKNPQSRTKSNSNSIVNCTTLTPEQLALKQVVWMNKNHAIKMAEYWKSVALSLEAPTLPDTQNINNESPPSNLPNTLPNNDNNNQPVEQNDAPVNNENRNVQDFGPNHDWLDWLYVSSRVFIFISVLYFYSSPGRFIVVVSFALLLYLYQSGILRHINEYNRRRFQQTEPQEQNANTNDTTAVAQDEPLFSFIWTVFSTFFTSLIPQQPDII